MRWGFVCAFVYTFVAAISAGICLADDVPSDTNPIRTLTVEQVEELGNRGGLLFLNGLTELPLDIAKALSRHTGTLHLDRPTALSQEAAEALSKQQGTLYLLGLKDISIEVAEHLSKHRHVSLLGLRRPEEATTWVEVLQKMHHSWSMAERGWLQYDLALATEANRYGEHKGWALIDAHDFTPKFQYGAIAGMAKTMAGCTLDRAIRREMANGHISQAVAFNHPRGKVIAWCGDAGRQPVAITSDATELVFIDPMGNEVETRKGGDAVIPFNVQPCCLLLVGATRVDRR